MEFKRKDIDRFWNKVDKRGQDECWEWKASKNYFGYGNIKIQGKTQGAHRISYEIANGSIPKGMFICHRCDNPSCVNPNHLFMGTHDDNMADRDKKRRQARGERVHTSKLTRSQAVEIRRRYVPYKRDETGSNCLSKEFGVSPEQITRIASGQKWRDK